MPIHTKSMAFKYRAFPTEEQKHQIAVTSGCARFVWNQALAISKDTYKATKKRPSQFDLSKMIPQWKQDPDTAWLKEADACALIYSLRALDQAYQNHFKCPKNFGRPKFHKRSNRQQYRTQLMRHEKHIDEENSRINLPKLGWVKINCHRPYKGIPISASVKREPDGKYYITVTVKDAPVKTLRKAKKSVGIDLGIHDRVVDSHGKHWTNSKHFYRAEKRLARLQRQLARKEKNSANWNKQRIKVAKLHAHIANCRYHDSQVMTTALVRQNQTICTETLRVKNMIKNKHLAKAISDAAFGEIVRELEYKCDWYGRDLIKIDTWYPSSKTCSSCGHVLDELKLSTRKWTCPQCGTVHDRDENAAKNILVQGLTMPTED